VISAHESFLKYAKAIVNLKAKSALKFDVIHISSMKTWRGGEQQVANLVLGQIAKGMKPLMLVKKGSDLMKFCQSNRISYYNLKFNNGFNIFSSLKIKKLSKRLGVSIVHMHCSPSHTLSVFSKLFGNPAKLVLSRRVIFPVRSNFLSYRKFNYSGISKIICVSESTRNVLSKTVKEIDKLDVIYDGINLERFKDVDSADFKNVLGLNGKRLIGNISAIVLEKDYYTFVDVAEQVLKSISNVHFLIIGAGAEYENIKNYIEQKGLEDDISMFGFRTDVPALLSILDVFLMTSTMEGLGSTILDAFASKVPVVATNVGGIPEIVIHEKTGLLSEPKNVESLSANVIRLIEDTDLSSKITKEAFHLVDSKFSTDKMVTLTNEVYESIV
jgi:glycosyltransferase involved in cell wall biosynthesis